MLNATPGTYLLLLHNHKKESVLIGKWGTLVVQPGVYLYVGSAFGPGGVRARVGRHLRLAQKAHWHLDYLRPLVEPLRVWVSYSPARLEHRWANALAGWPELTPVPGFGCSDCRCVAHLFYAPAIADTSIFSSLGEGIEAISFEKR